MSLNLILLELNKTFVGSGNVSSLKLGMARGVCILAATKMMIKIIELQPKLVKKYYRIWRCIKGSS